MLRDRSAQFLLTKKAPIWRLVSYATVCQLSGVVHITGVHAHYTDHPRPCKHVMNDKKELSGIIKISNVCSLVSRE